MAIGDLLDRFSLRRIRALPAVVAVVFALLAWTGVRSLFSGEAAQDAPPPPAAPAPEASAAPAAPPAAEPEAPVHPKLLVASQALRSGVMLVSDLVEWQEWREEADLDPSLVVVRDLVPLEAVLGSVTVRPYAPGTPIAWDGIIVPGGPGFISAVLQPGMRAVTIRVDQATTSANIIFPGDRVDVILVGAAFGGEMVAQTIVEDVRVVAVGSAILSWDRFMGQASLGRLEAGADGAGRAGRAGGLPRGDSYTLEVGTREADLIALAATSGTIILAMRSVVPPALPDYGQYGLRLPVRLAEIMSDGMEDEMMAAEVAPPRSVRVIRFRNGVAEDQTVLLEPRGAGADSMPGDLEAPNAALGAET